jgi:hypothetical protein
MARRRRGEIPASLARGRERFEAWRRDRTPGARIPDRLWGLAVKLADAHGLSRTVSALKLDYYSLKKRVESKDSGSVSNPGTFVEFSPPSPAGSGECVIEFEDGSGASLRVHLRGCETPDLAALVRCLRSSE